MNNVPTGTGAHEKDFGTLLLQTIIGVPQFQILVHFTGKHDNLFVFQQHVFLPSSIASHHLLFSPCHPKMRGSFIFVKMHSERIRPDLSSGLQG
jgi:hypothetical protein